MPKPITRSGNPSLPQEVRDFGAKNPRRRVRVNLSFSSAEVWALEELAKERHLPLSTYLRQLVLNSNQVKVASAAQRQRDWQAGGGRTEQRDDVDTKSRKFGTKPRSMKAPLEQLAQLVPSGQGEIPYHRTKEARGLLSALSPGQAAIAEALMLKVRGQPTLDQYAAAGVDLKALKG